MQKFTAKIVDLMKSEGLYASQGGPIILSQVFNLFNLIRQIQCHQTEPNPLH